MKISIKFYLRIAQISLFIFTKYNIVGCNREYFGTSFYVFYFYLVILFNILISFHFLHSLAYYLENIPTFLLENLQLINDKNNKGNG